MARGEALRGRCGDRRGASALEFALVFPLFFFVLYGSISYGLVFALQQSLTFAAEQGARAAVAADPSEPDFESTVLALARAAVADSLAWLSGDLRAAILGADSQKVGVSLSSDASGRTLIVVVVEHPAYGANPPIPSLRFPGLGAIPPLPASLSARAIAQL